MMINAVPSIPLEESIDDVLRVRVLEVGGADGCKLGARSASLRPEDYDPRLNAWCNDDARTLLSSMIAPKMHRLPVR